LRRLDRYLMDRFEPPQQDFRRHRCRRDGWRSSFPAHHSYCCLADPERAEAIGCTWGKDGRYRLGQAGPEVDQRPSRLRNQSPKPRARC
jgi:hypothetical protein